MSNADFDFAAAVNERLVGKTIATAERIDLHCPVQCVRIHFTDGTHADIQSEHDEGFILRCSDNP
jgi:hypothetical protein